MLIKDRKFVRLLEQPEIEKALRRLARKINADYRDKNPLIVAVLNGSFIFAADLMRLLGKNFRISFVKISSYEELESTGNIKQLIGLNENIFKQDVLILEDIVDTGKTMEKMLDKLTELGPASVEIVTLLRKDKHDALKDRIKYTGFQIEDRFVVGYGLDYDGYGRNLKEIYQLK